MQYYFFLVKKKKVVPPPRSGGKIEVVFTPRVFKTPSRESKAPEEEQVCKMLLRYLLYYSKFNKIK